MRSSILLVALGAGLAAQQLEEDAHGLLQVGKINAQGKGRDTEGCLSPGGCHKAPDNKLGHSKPSVDLCAQTIGGAALVQKATFSQNDECACPEGQVVLCPRGQAVGNSGGKFFHSFFAGLGCSCSDTGVTRGLPHSDATAVPSRTVAPLLCTSVNGNGGNWAATLGFVSEALLTYLDEANDETALVDLNCFAGASSGSAVTMVMMNLLSNPSFVTQAGQPITHAQARRVARAVGLLATNGDLQQGEGAFTIVKTLLERSADWGEGAWNKSGTPLKLGDIIAAFGRNIVLARRMPDSFVDLEVEASIKDRPGTLSRENVLAQTSAANYLAVSDVPKLDRAGGMAGLDDVTTEQLTSAVKDVRDGIESYCQSFLDFLNVGRFQNQRNGVLVENLPVSKHYTWTQAGVDALKQAKVHSALGSPLSGGPVEQSTVSILSGHIATLLSLNFWVEGEEVLPYLDTLSDLDVVLEEPPVDGIMTMAWVQERSKTDIGVVGISYPKTRIMAMMSRSTAERVLASRSYRSAIKECREGRGETKGFMCRYIIAVVDKQRPMFAFAVQEPQNSIPYAEYLKDTDVVAGFDPLVSESGFALQSTREEGGLNPRILILGGYVGRAQFSMLQECYAEGSETRAPRIFWGKVIEPAFPRNIVKDLLSETKEEAEANWDDYNEWKYNKDYHSTEVFIEGKADWDCGARLPANLAGNSWRLRLHGAGVARLNRKEALDDLTELQPFLFDLMSSCEAETLAREAQEQAVGKPGTQEPNVDVFLIDQVENVLPRAPDWYPDNLKGIIWMDQVGFYGRSDISDGAPDGTLSFGDPANLLNPESHEIPVSITGPAWEWFNNAAGYKLFKSAKAADFIYNFEWNKEYTFARIVPTIKRFIKIPGWAVNFTMELQPTHQDTSICPPRTGASREDITRCAKWKRVSTTGPNSNEALYFAYEIVDKDGTRVQPYYNKYLEWLNQNSEPDQGAANANGLVFKSDFNMQSATAFHGIAGTAYKSFVKKDCPEGPESSQACKLTPTLRSLSKELGCPKISKQFCGDISETLDVLAGKKRPVLADLRYLVDMAQLGSGYSSTFYNASDKCCNSGDKSCCKHARANFPGPEAVSVLSNAQMQAKMREVPSRLASGAITRRNMLGFILLNDIFWSDMPEGERGLGLGGQSVTVHSLVRPIIDGIFGHAAGWDVSTIQKSAVDFTSKRSKMNFQNDPKIWTTQVLHQIAFGVEISEKEAQDFVDFQGKVVPTVGLPQFLVDAARLANMEDKLRQALNIPDVLAKKEKYLKRWTPVVKERHCQHCNDTETAMVMSNVLDALIFAGGLSVPGVISPGISLLYAGDGSPSPGFKLTQANALLFAWETARYFPPVLGFPYVDKAEDRPLQIMTVGVGQRAADAWGEDAETPSFRLRDYDTYQKFWVGHADHAEDPKGTGTRRCPGKTLSMQMIEAWYKAWDQAAWAPAENTTFQYKDTVLFVNDFTLVRTSESARADDM